MFGSRVGTQHMEPTKYRELIEAIVSGAMDQHDRENAIKIALGELADVWPDTIPDRTALKKT